MGHISGVYLSHCVTRICSDLPNQPEAGRRGDERYRDQINQRLGTRKSCLQCRLVSSNSQANRAGKALPEAAAKYNFAGECVVSGKVAGGLVVSKQSVRWLVAASRQTCSSRNSLPPPTLNFKQRDENALSVKGREQWPWQACPARAGAIASNGFEPSAVQTVVSGVPTNDRCRAIRAYSRRSPVWLELFSRMK